MKYYKGCKLFKSDVVIMVVTSFDGTGSCIGFVFDSSRVAVVIAVAVAVALAVAVAVDSATDVDFARNESSLVLVLLCTSLWFMVAFACFTVLRFTFCFCKKCKNNDGKMAIVFMYVRYLKLQITASFTYFILYHQYAGIKIIFPGTSSTSSVLIFA